MTQVDQGPTRVDIRIEGREADQLEALRATDMRSRSQEVKWLIAQEVARREAAPADAAKVAG